MVKDLRGVIINCEVVIKLEISNYVQFDHY